MKKTLIIISALIALIIGGAFIYRISQPRKLVHISIDDSICLNEIDGLNSPFDHHILKKLKLFHRLYGAKFSLYSFKPDSMTNNGQIKRSVDIHNRAFSEASDWLKLGYHGLSQMDFDSLAARNDYLDNAASATDFYKTLGGQRSLTSTVRLDRFYGDSAVLSKANQLGIKTFLCADNPKRNSYVFTSRQTDSLDNDNILHNKYGKFLRTDLRLEKSKIKECISREHLNDSIFVVFTHEWTFHQVELKMHILMMMLWLHNYEFVTEL